jgi:hypothetical protein
MNDILSYVKEEVCVLCQTFFEDDLIVMMSQGESVPHNIVAVARMSGLDAQEAFDYIGTMLDSRYERWERAVDVVPDWDEDINRDVEKYIRGVADVVRANLNWR